MTRTLVLFALLTAACGATTNPGSHALVLPQWQQAPPLVIAFVGDTNGHRIVTPDTPETNEDPLEPVGVLLGSGDLFVFNLEGVLDSGLFLPGSCAALPQQSLIPSPVRAVEFYARAPVNVATLANNHLMDCGLGGIEETRLALAARGIDFLGAGLNTEDASRPLRLEVNAVRIGMAAFLAMEQSASLAGETSPGAAPWSSVTSPEAIEALAASEDLVVVALHLHLAQGWTETTAPAHLAIAEQALQAGAHIFVGHGPHAPQGIVARNGGLAFLSLGNFLFDPGYVMPEIAHRSLVALVAVYPERIVAALVPLQLDGRGRPVPASAAQGDLTLRSIANLSASFGTTVAIREGVGYVEVARE